MMSFFCQLVKAKIVRLCAYRPAFAKGNGMAGKLRVRAFLHFVKSVESVAKIFRAIRGLLLRN